MSEGNANVIEDDDAQQHSGMVTSRGMKGI
jgi:hypothetical protein